MKTAFDEFIEDPARRRIYEQESLAFEATELIAELMSNHDVSKSELAKRIGKSKAYVTQLLSGGRNMTLHTFADLAYALGGRVEFGYLPLDDDKAGRVDTWVLPATQAAYKPSTIPGDGIRKTDDKQGCGIAA